MMPKEALCIAGDETWSVQRAIRYAFAIAMIGEISPLLFHSVNGERIPERVYLSVDFYRDWADGYSFRHSLSYCDARERVVRWQ